MCLLYTEQNTKKKHISKDLDIIKKQINLIRQQNE